MTKCHLSNTPTLSFSFEEILHILLFFCCYLRQICSNVWMLVKWLHFCLFQDMETQQVSEAESVREQLQDLQEQISAHKMAKQEAEAELERQKQVRNSWKLDLFLGTMWCHQQSIWLNKRIFGYLGSVRLIFCPVFQRNPQKLGECHWVKEGAAWTKQWSGLSGYSW